MATDGHGDSEGLTEPVMINVADEAEAYQKIAEFEADNPDFKATALHVQGRLVEAGIEVRIEGPGVHAVVVIDPTSDPAAMYVVIENLPMAVQTSLAELALRHE